LYFYHTLKHFNMKNVFILLLLAAGFASCNNADNGSSNDKEATNKALVQRFYDEVVNAHNPNLIDSFCHAEFTDHDPSPGHSGKGSADLKANFTELFASFPDVRMTTDFMVANGDTVAVYMTLTGTNSGAMGNMPATNKQITIKGIDIVALRDGKATDRWGVFDNMTMMAQMGMMGGAAPADSSNMPAPADTTKKTL
jgi:predicted ester cyclase